MTVNEKTKEKLLKIGLSEAFAVELATDRSLSQVQKMTGAQVAQITRTSPEEANRIRDLVISKEAQELNRRMKFQACRQMLSVALFSVAGDVAQLCDDKGLVDVHRLMKDYAAESGNEFKRPPGFFLGMFEDDPARAVRSACFLIAAAVGVSAAVIYGGFRVIFVSEYQVEIIPGNISTHDLRGVVTGLSELDKENISHLEPDTAKFLNRNLDLAAVDITGIREGDTVTEVNPVKTPRVKDIHDHRADDLRWPSQYGGMHGVVIEKYRCAGILDVEFQLPGRPRAYVHETHCKLMPDNLDKSALRGFI